MTSNYFSHDSNARNDEKLVRLRMRHKAAGYGVYFMILERMRDANNYMCVKDYNLIAFDLREDAALIKSVVEDFGLFVFTDDGKYFYSESFLRRMEKKDVVSQTKRKAAKKRWCTEDDHSTCNADAMHMHSTCNADAMHMHSTCNADAMQESKERKESKENNIAPNGALSDGDARRTQPKSFRSMVIKYFNKKMNGKSIKAITSINDGTKRADWLRARRREYGDDAIFRMIDKASESEFLNGRNQRGFTASFDWLVKPNNFPKVLEGNYDNEKTTGYENNWTDNSAAQRAADVAAIVARLAAEDDAREQVR